jgi:xanthine dehydrogenase accessory factor
MNRNAWLGNYQEMRDVVRQLIQGLAQDRELIVCQVVETRGSTPQKAGALMVVDTAGGQAGTLGGGCVENEVKLKALQQLGQSGTALHTFVLDHDYAWADGLICGGKMVIVTQPVCGSEALAYYRVLDEVIGEGEGHTEAIVINPSSAPGTALGRRFLLDARGDVRISWPAAPMPQGLVSRLAPPSERPKPSVQNGVAFLPAWPRIRLIVVGAGHVGQAVASLAAQVDFDVWVVDDRQQYASRERFPTAQRLVVGPFDETLESLEISPQTYALIVTRGHGHDQEALFHLAGTPAAYVGLIGSRRKIRLIFDNLREAGVPEPALARVTAPVGFDIGSQSVMEIAVSIVAELIARRNLGERGVPSRVRGDISRAATTPARPGAGVVTTP